LAGGNQSRHREKEDAKVLRQTWKADPGIVKNNASPVPQTLARGNGQKS
jgi:hypothetical protein